MTEYLPLIGLGFNFLMVGLLVYYRLHKRFKKERAANKWELIESNVVEIIIGLIVIPDVVTLLVKAMV